MERVVLYQSGGKVWKLLIDDIQQLLLVEARDENEREVSFSAIDLATGTPLWIDYVLEEPWWLSMQYAKNGVLLISEFEDDQHPIAKALIAIDAKKGEGLWQYDGIFETANEQHVIVKQEQVYTRIELISGHHQTVETEEIDRFSPSSSSVQLPQHYSEGSTHFETVATFLQNRLGIAPALAIDYGESAQHIILAYYEQETPYYQHHLVIMNKSGDLLSTLALGKQLTGVGNEPFLLYEELVIFVSDKNKVMCIQL